MHRRGFLAGAVSFATGVAAAAERPIPIVDTHQHLWDLARFKLPWIKVGEEPLGRSYGPAEFAEATRGLDVVQAVYMEVDVAPEQRAAEADSILDLIRSGKAPTVAAVIGGRPASEEFRAYLDRYRNEPAIKGVRQVLHSGETPPGTCLDPAFVRGIRLLGERGLMFDLCMRSGELADAARLIDACPATRFILDHCGNADVRARDRSAWKRDLAAVANRGDRAVCKVSGIVASARGAPWSADDLAPIVDHVLDTFGPDRVMFGGDWPVCTLATSYRRWVEALRSIVAARPEADRRKLFHDNAVRVYGLA